MFLSFSWMVITYVSVLLAVAFFILLERKGLSYIQARKGPNKVGYFGLVQSFADALKLFLKEENNIQNSNKVPYFLAPVLSLILSLSVWSLYWSSFHLWYFNMGVLFFLCVSALNVYGTMMAGWSSNSKYSLLGSLRAVAQTISYEVTLFLILLSAITISASFSLLSIFNHQLFIWTALLMMPMFMMWLVVCIAETNRAPFDFAEGESELVSGFNIEYGSGAFALLFLAEYASILFMSMLTTVLFFGTKNLWMLDNFSFWLKASCVAFFFIWVRGSFPRMRYDLLMKLTWLSFLPISLMILSTVLATKFMFNL
uniref:NADH-ubiquinone oxidoreductase chain 1 n=1 Tax=Acanthochitona avicula TaxID=1503212 RepID=A0A6H1PGD2_9MOLL|nr:NADH dehydrogenase subunit 1 [Acanthochitona avicula]QIZ12680.1 NADH dehydrogenase subunit 1 [Acanthochitona avicula]